MRYEEKRLEELSKLEYPKTVNLFNGEMHPLYEEECKLKQILNGGD